MASAHQFPEWAQNKVVYEVNLRQYTPEGTIAAFRRHLPRLKDLGAGILWFMPLQPVGIKNRKGTLGSYYSIRNYHDVDAAYGTFSEFAALVDEIHSLGMYVILDWVANHTAWDHHWVQDHPGFYRRNENGSIAPPFPEWEDVIALDYNNKGCQAEMIKEMKFWLVNAHIDGFRCDMAMLVPAAFWNRAHRELNQVKQVFMLAEADQRDLADEAFDVLYNWNLFHVFNSIAQGKNTADELRWRIPAEIYSFPQGHDNLLFISNHDENSWNGSELERLGEALEPLAMLIFTLPGMPLIYSGQEAGNGKRLQFFDKDVIEWKDDKMAALYKTLASLRNSCPALWSPRPNGTLQLIRTSADQQVFCFIRQSGNDRLLVLLNLSGGDSQFHFEGSGYEGSYTDVFNRQMPVSIGDSPCFALGPWDYRLLKSR